MSTLLIVVAVVFLLLGVFYLIPGVNHPLTFSTSGNPADPQIKHAIVLFVVAVFAFLGSRFARSSTVR
jgi:amino acid permease